MQGLRPTQSVLYQIVRDHVETFRAQAGRVFEGERLPRFIEEEFEGFLRCGWLAGGAGSSAPCGVRSLHLRRASPSEGGSSVA